MDRTLMSIWTVMAISFGMALGIMIGGVIIDRKWRSLHSEMRYMQGGDYGYKVDRKPLTVLYKHSNGKLYDFPQSLGD